MFKIEYMPKSIYSNNNNPQEHIYHPRKRLSKTLHDSFSKGPNLYSNSFLFERRSNSVVMKDIKDNSFFNNNNNNNTNNENNNNNDKINEKIDKEKENGEVDDININKKNNINNELKQDKNKKKEENENKEKKKMKYRKKTQLNINIKK